MDSLLIDTCDIVRKTETSRTSSNNPVYTESTIATGVKCRIANTSGIESKYPFRAIPYNYRLFIKYQGLSERDKIVSSGSTYELTSVYNVKDNVGYHHTEAWLEKVTP